ncbi:pilin [Sansalvadorimonas verongulae]|nr:pilin [Sansalvadorimonas verongulae]
MHYKKQGFTLIELMIVVAIIGIVASFALPAYQNYRARSVIAGEILPALKKAAGDLTEYYASQGTVNGYCDNFATDITISTQYISSLECNPRTGTQTIRFVAHLATDQMPGSFPSDPRILFFPTLNEGSISWHCAYHSDASFRIPEEYLPTSCRGNYVVDWSLFVNGVDVTASGIALTE